MAVFENITSKKQTEKDLENAKIAARNVSEDLQVEKENLAYVVAKDEAILAAIGDGVIICDVDGKITFVNQSAQHMFGFTSKEVTGKFLFDVVGLEDQKENPILPDKRPINMVLATTADVAYYYVRKDKTKFPTAIKVQPVILENKMVGAVEIFRDITHEKEIDKAKNEFVSLASHQLKTPLTAVKLLTEIILKGGVGPFTKKQEEYLNDISSSNQRMIDLVNALLSVSRIEMGEFTIQVDKKDIRAIVQNVFYELTPALEKKQIRLQQHYQKSPNTVMIDETLFRMVIGNLATNAIHYTDKGGKIQVECKELPRGQLLGGEKLSKDSFTITIADSGCGIPKKQQGSLFTKFFRADNAIIKHTDGTGLGLYIVKSVLDKSSGSIWFTSKESEGTAFYVAIPMTGMRAKAASQGLIM